MKSVSVDMLRSFIAIYKQGGISCAAKYLCRPQPTISIQLKKLEEFFGANLIDRRSNLNKLTHSGHLLMNYAEEIIKLNDEAVRTINADFFRGRVNLGMPRELVTGVLSGFISSFSNIFQDYALEVSYENNEWLKASNLFNYDLKLTCCIDDFSSGGEVVFEDDLVWVAKKGCVISTSSRVMLVVSSAGCVYRERAIKALDEKRIPWNIACVVSDSATIESVIGSGLGVGVMVRGAVPDSLEVISTSYKFPDLGTLVVNLSACKPQWKGQVDLLADDIRRTFYGGQVFNLTCTA